MVSFPQVSTGNKEYREKEQESILVTFPIQDAFNDGVIPCVIFQLVI